MKDARNFFDGPRFDNARGNPKTLHDLKEAGGHLIAVCKRCLHRAVVKPADVIPTLGWDFTLFEMRKVLRCGNCKARGLANVHEVWE